MRLDHPIFHEPLDVGVELEPNDWETEFDDRGVWVVQTGEPGKTVDYGVVSDGHGFEDSPDCERISGGVNSKGPWAVAIGREANLLQWGFYAAPDSMTESARRAFLNAIVYMKRFDGRAPLVRKTARGRTWMEQKIAMIDDLDGMPAEQRERYVEYLEASFPADLIAEHGLDADALAGWYEANVEFIREVGGEHVVDEDLAALGVSNRRPEFLALLRERLTDDPYDLVALELAERYLDGGASGAAAILEWIDAHADRAFFSDVGGFRWFVDTRPEDGAARAVSASAGR